MQTEFNLEALRICASHSLRDFYLWKLTSEMQENQQENNAVFTLEHIWNIEEED